MYQTVREAFLPFVLGLLTVGLFSAYDRASVPVVKYERRVPSLDEMVQTEIAQSSPDERLPDLVPLPARDLTLEDGPDGHLRLLFSTTYFNQGSGPVELVADARTAGLADDIDRFVSQRIYRKDDTFSDHVVGTFSWHQEHRHYHFSDFVSYILTSESGSNEPILLHKATFCIRDVSRLKNAVEGKKGSATYTVCGKERQGVSVGWGDTYYYNYPDQAIDLSDIASGTYRLTFVVNPARRLREQAYLNNKSSVVFSLNKDNRSLTVQSESPAHSPEIEHIHLDDPFGL